MKNVFEQTAELIRIELLKRVFVVDVTCTPTKVDKFNVKTTSFQTTPVLFKNVWIESGIACFQENENEKGIKYTDYYVSLSVCYEYFDGGRNGCKLFAIEFRGFEDWDEIRILSIK